MDKIYGRDREITIIQNYSYDSRGNTTFIDESGQYYDEVEFEYEHETSGPKDLVSKNKVFGYDSLNRLIEEDNNVLGKYTYQYQNEKLMSVKRNNEMHKNFEYSSSGRRIKCNNIPISYDSYGNITRYINDLLWNNRNLLEKYGNSEYKYNAQGIRYLKSNDKILINYHIDGSRILKENWSDGNTFRYYYDAEGICGIRYKEKNYNLIRDGLGNVSKIMYYNKLIGGYDYDSYGILKLIK